MQFKFAPKCALYDYTARNLEAMGSAVASGKMKKSIA